MTQALYARICLGERLVAIAVVGALCVFLVPALKDRTPWQPAEEPVVEAEEPERPPRCECGRG